MYGQGNELEYLEISVRNYIFFSLNETINSTALFSKWIESLFL